MSLFNPDIIEESNEWAENELYRPGLQLCPVCKRPAWIERKSDYKIYHTVYSLYKEYRDLVKYRFAREKFIEIVKKECHDAVRYKDTTYYSWWWFCDNFVDSHKDLYCFW